MAYSSMEKPPLKTLKVSGALIKNGIKITVKSRDFLIEYPERIWRQTPLAIKQIMLDNLTFGDTHFLGVTLGCNQINYNTRFPFTEAFLYRNQMMDMTKSAQWDNAPITSYLQQFYNLEFTFARGPALLPPSKPVRTKTRQQPVAIIPFSFGKESLLSFALALEMGMKPVLVYSQEPSMAHEEEHKKRMIKEFSQKFKVDMHFVKNGPGLFRYDAAFRQKPGTEVGWGSQTTLVVLQMLPFVFAYDAQYMLFGTEYANDLHEYDQGWKVFHSPDQTVLFTIQQDIMLRLITGGACRVHTMVEPIDQINIMDILHKRYPEIGKYQFSCTAEFPLVPGSQWCHRCYKCHRMFVLARCCHINPATIGFKKDLLREPGHYQEYFGNMRTSGSAWDLDFAFYILYRRGDTSPYVKEFARTKLKNLPPWQFYYRYFTKLKPHFNLPEDYAAKLLKIFEAELKSLKKLVGGPGSRGGRAKYP